MCPLLGTDLLDSAAKWVPEPETSGTCICALGVQGRRGEGVGDGEPGQRQTDVETENATRATPSRPGL